MSPRCSTNPITTFIRGAPAPSQDLSDSVCRGQQGDDEARIGFALRPLRLADHTPRPAPALARRPDELLGPPRRLPDDVLGKIQYALEPIGFARHQRLAGKVGVRARNDASLRPAGAKLRHDAGDLLNPGLFQCRARQPHVSRALAVSATRCRGAIPLRQIGR
jgi:hypothetical protein